MADFDKKDYEIFKGKKLSDVFQDIYQNSRSKKEQINALIMDLKKLVNSLSDATTAVPLIAEYLDISVKNDEHLVKLAEIVQRLLKDVGKNDNDDGVLSEEERRQLLTAVENEFSEELEKEDEKLSKLNQKTNEVKNNL